MRCTQYVFLLLLFVLSVLLAGCDFRDILDDYPVSGVKIKFNWKGVDKLPEGMRVIFYPKSEEGRKVESYLSVEGGEVKVPPGFAMMMRMRRLRLILIIAKGLKQVRRWCGHRTLYM